MRANTPTMGSAEVCPQPGHPQGTGLKHLGGALAATKTRRQATPEPPTRLHEIDEALRWSSLTYTIPRDHVWERWVDHLLDQRLRLMPHDTRHGSR